MNNISNNNRDFDLFRSDHIKIKDLKVGEDGALKKKSIFDKIKDIFLSKKEKQKAHEAVKNKLIVYVKSIDSTKELRNIFKKISQLRDAQLIFDLKNQGTLTQKMENKLSPELKKLRETKTKVLQSKELNKEKQLEQLNLAIRIEKANLGQRLGIDFIKNKGATGTALIRNLKGKYIGVFKPTHEYTPLKARILNNIKRIFGGQLSYLSSKTDAQAKAEVAAYRLDRHFGFGLSPPSQFVELDNKKGTFQGFLKSFKEAKEFMDSSRSEGISLPKTEYNWNLAEFQKMAIFDYLIGNLDRHEENWGLAQIKKEGKEVESLKIIDNANAFLCKNPDAEGVVKNQYKWKTLEIAKAPLEQSVIEFIEERLTDEKLNEFISEIERDFDTNMWDFFNEEIKAGLRDRLHVIQHLAQGKGTPAQLGHIVSDADIILLS